MQEVNNELTEREFVKSWNYIIQFLMSAETAWKKHRKLMENGGSTDGLTTYKSQQMATLVFNRSTSFFKAMETFWPYCNINGGLEAFKLPLPKTKLKSKEKVNDE